MSKNVEVEALCILGPSVRDEVRAGHLCCGYEFLTVVNSQEYHQLIIEGAGSEPKGRIDGR